MRHFWRRFKPRAVGTEIALKPALVGSIWQQAVAHVDELFPGRQIRDDVLTRTIQSTWDKATSSNDPVLWLAALILQSPRASVAQEQMDEHPHGYRNRHERLFELIDFNDTLVSAVLALPESELPQFADVAKRAMDAFCKRVKSRCFSNEQFEAIVHGLSREIAVYRGAKAEGYEVSMTSRTQDALGIDMVIRDPASGRSINVDCKTHSAFYYRLKDLVHEGRMTTEESAIAEDKGYCRVVNGDDSQRVAIILWRIDEQTYGDIQAFSLADPARLGNALHDIIQAEGVPASPDL